MSVWFFETLLLGTASYVCAVRVTQGRGLLERLLVTCCTHVTLILLVSYSCALANEFFFWPVLFGSTVLGGVLAAITLRNFPRDVLRRDQHALRNIFCDVSRGEKIAWSLSLASALGAIVLSMSHVVFFPNWSWDVVWYHKPMTNYLLQTGSLAWVPTNIPHLNSFPKHTEILSAWNVLLTGSTTLDDLPQISLGILGALAVAAMCRRLGVSRLASLGLGSVWLSLPSVALQLHTTHADVPAATFFLIAFYFLTQKEFRGLDCGMTFLAFGLCAGTKGTGLFWFALLAPGLALRVGMRLWKKRHRGWLRSVGECLGFSAVLLYPGFVIYVVNLFKTHNPYWPIQVKIPGLGLTLPGTKTALEMGNSPPAFFGFQWEGFAKMVRLWFSTQGVFYPDLREFPFGHVFPFMLLPALLWAAMWSLKKNSPYRRWLACAWLLAAVSVWVPAAWWGRFTLGLPAAGLCALGALYSALHFTEIRTGVAVMTGLLVWASWPLQFPGYRVLPHVGFSSNVQKENQHRLREAISWLWPEDLAWVREHEMRRGDVLLYDEHATFVGEYWTEDVRNRVEYFAQEQQAPEIYLEHAREKKARWLVVGRQTKLNEYLLQNPHDYRAVGPLPKQNAQLFQVLSVSP